MVQSNSRTRTCRAMSYTYAHCIN